MININWTYADKFIVSVLTSAAAYLNSPDMGWKQAVVLGIGSVLVWLVPNTSKQTVTLPTNGTTPNVGLMPNEREELNLLRSQKAQS